MRSTRSTNPERRASRRRYEPVDERSTSGAANGASKSTYAVPAYFYEDLVCGFTSKASFIWWWNLLAGLMHVALAVWALVVGSGGCDGFGTPLLMMYTTRLNWTDGDLHPELQPWPEAPLRLTWMTFAFFVLSATAHALIVAFNARQADPPVWWRDWYYRWIDQCRQPLRYAQPSVSLPQL